MNNLEMSVKSYELSKELRDDLKTIINMTHSLPELNKDSGQDEINNHSIIYNLCKIKLQRCKQSIKELRIITIAMGMYTSLEKIDLAERQVLYLEENLSEIIKGLNSINDLTKIINDIKEEREI